MKTIIYSILALFLLNSCAIVRPGEVGVKQKLGRIKGKERPQGVYMLNPFTTKMVKVPTRTINMAVSLESLPSKEGLSIGCEMAVLFHIEPQYAVKIVETVGVKNGQGIILSALRSAAADVTAKFLAKDLHTAEREKIEQAITDRLTEVLGGRGFTVEALLLKSIRLPESLYKAIEEKLEAEQRAQTMQYVLERQRQEADRMRIEAEGIRDSQKIIAEGLTELLIKYKSLEVFDRLSKSNNSKIIITDGKAPMLINE
jgi:regulator of protease activity HflC (stomatin/prohibitin superfamily)